MDQKGCTTGKHSWVPKQDKKKVACRHDWHQTRNAVVITIYAKNALPEFCTIEANQTVVSNPKIMALDTPNGFDASNIQIVLILQIQRGK
uniref:CS domain-containing protein n=1 Tax=Oryzias sinensis TaxID=183150 RepID=A0A8C7WV10_9TELE